jgi:hypothetical protein
MLPYTIALPITAADETTMPKSRDAAIGNTALALRTPRPYREESLG